MKKLSSKGMKTLKTFHLLLVMMWVIGVLAMSMLFLLKPDTGEGLYTTLNIILFIDDVFVVPGALLTVVTGIVYGIFTNWGFFKHRWITIKWIVSILVILVGTFYFKPHLDAAIEAADQIRNTGIYAFSDIPDTQINQYSSFLQGIALVVLVVISVFKPWKNKKA